jgi:hypothetical protein
VFRFIIGDVERHLTGNMEINRNGMPSDWSDLSSVPLIVSGLSNEDNNREIIENRLRAFLGIRPRIRVWAVDRFRTI